MWITRRGLENYKECEKSDPPRVAQPRVVDRIFYPSCHFNPHQCNPHFIDHPMFFLHDCCNHWSISQEKVFFNEYIKWEKLQQWENTSNLKILTFLVTHEKCTFHTELFSITYKKCTFHTEFSNHVWKVHFSYVIEQLRMKSFKIIGKSSTPVM